MLRLDVTAFAPDIARELEARAGRSVSRGHLYTSLDRLEDKGLLRWKVASSTAVRDGLPAASTRSRRPASERCGRRATSCSECGAGSRGSSMSDRRPPRFARWLLIARCLAASAATPSAATS